MTRKNYILALAALVAFPLLAGCGSMFRKDNATPAAQLDPADQKKPLSPVEAEEAFAKAQGEGVQYVQAGRYGLAIGAFEAALQVRPDSTDAMFNLGACHEAIGDPLRAINYYRRVLAVTPDDPDCYRNLGTSFIKLYHREQSPAWKKMAEDSWRRSLQLQPNQPEVKTFLASLAK